MMASAFFSEPVNGVSNVMVYRTGRSSVAVSTQNALTDEQLEELYWIVAFMAETGKRLGEAIDHKMTL